MTIKMNIALARAIGHMKVDTGGPRGNFGVYLATPDPQHTGFGMLKKFDYNDPAVIWPIAKRYNCFPQKVPEKPGTWKSYRIGAMYSGTGNTPEQAVAAAVIAMHLAGEL